MLTGRREDAYGGALVIDHPAAAAYCLPGRRHEVVFTTAALAALDREEVDAVLAHERAHLRGRHHLVLAVPSALARAFPPVPAFRDAARELARLVEMRADDVAAAGRGRVTVARAVVRLAEGSTPAAALGASGGNALARVRRLVAPVHPLGILRTSLTAAALTTVLAAPVLLVAAPVVEASRADYCAADAG
jgi:Zn-dependent protease with chaperone function